MDVDESAVQCPCICQNIRMSVRNRRDQLLAFGLAVDVRQRGSDKCVLHVSPDHLGRTSRISMA